MAHILFRPTCGNCGHILVRRTVNVTTVDRKLIPYGQGANSFSALYEDYNIAPDHCPYCGAPFESVVMPTKLPIDDEDIQAYR